MNQRDMAAVSRAYSRGSDFRWYEDGALRYRSADEVLAALEQFPPGTTLTTTLSNIEIHPLQEIHVRVGAEFRTRVSLPHGTFEYQGAFTALLQRQAESYVFLAGHTSSARPDETRTVEARQR